MYALGVDLGTTFTAAAVWRDGRAEICALGTRAAVIPSVVLPRTDGSFLTGEAAARRAAIEPDRVAREFKRRIGDSTPLLLGGSPYSAEALTARLLASVITLVSAREGGTPASVCVCHPANWGPYKTDLLRQAVRLADVRVPVIYTTEPEAAAVSYARQERLSPGDTVAVYDLGGGTFDAAVLRRTGGGFEILGQPEGIERLGGVDVDAAVFHHVARSVGTALTDLDEDDPAAMAAVARLRAECTEAKEALSSDTDVTIPVLLPTTSTEVRLTRAELEDMVRPALYDSIESLKRAIRSAGVDPAGLSAVLLVGGSSRMPLVAQLVGAELGRPIAVDTHPKHAVALGAAWLASGTALPIEPGPAPATRAVRTAPEAAPRPRTAVPPAQLGRPVQQPLQQQVQRLRQARQAPLVPRPVYGRGTTSPALRASPPADHTQFAPPASPPAGYPQPPPASPPAGYPQRSAPRSVSPESGPLPFEPSPQRFSDVTLSPPLRYAAPPRRSARPFVIGAAAALGALVAVVVVWAALNPAAARQYVPFGSSAASSGAGVGVDGGAGAPSGAGVGVDGGAAEAGEAGPTPARPAPGNASGARTGMLLVSVRISGRGWVRSEDGRINCPGSCQVTIPANGQLLLVASGQGFLGWSQCSQRNSVRCTVGNARGTASPLARFATGSAGGTGAAASPADGKLPATAVPSISEAPESPTPAMTPSASVTPAPTSTAAPVTTTPVTDSSTAATPSPT
ncbi:MAG TPA: Hsp70 family protein [Kineosporiaceae bacterium]